MQGVLLNQSRILKRIVIVSLIVNIILTFCVVSFYQQTVSSIEQNMVVGRASVNSVGVRLDSKSYTYKGVAMKVEVELRSGEGRMLINTQLKMGMSVQTSMQTATLVAQNLAPRLLRPVDIILTIEAESKDDVVDGSSAGAAIAIAMIAAIRNQSPSQSIFITGTVNSIGTIGRVGGVLEKALACAEAGATKFLVPRTQGMLVINKTKPEEPYPGIVLDHIQKMQGTVVVQEAEVNQPVPIRINLNEYLAQLGYKTEVIEVETVAEAYQIFVEQKPREDSKVENRQQEANS